MEKLTQIVNDQLKILEELKAHHSRLLERVAALEARQGDLEAAVLAQAKALGVVDEAVVKLTRTITGDPPTSPPVH